MTIRNIDGALEDELRARAARHGRSMEDEARDILTATLVPAGDDVPEPAPAENMAVAIRRRFAPLGGVELELPKREPQRDPIDFGE